VHQVWQSLEQSSSDHAAAAARVLERLRRPRLFAEDEPSYQVSGLPDRRAADGKTAEQSPDSRDPLNPACLSDDAPQVEDMFPIPFDPMPSFADVQAPGTRHLRTFPSVLAWPAKDELLAALSVEAQHSAELAAQLRPGKRQQLQSMLIASANSHLQHSHARALKHLGEEEPLDCAVNSDWASNADFHVADDYNLVFPLDEIDKQFTRTVLPVSVHADLNYALSVW